MQDQYFLRFARILTCPYNNRALQVKEVLVATLHCKMAYRIQNHPLDLTLPQFVSKEALLIAVDTAAPRARVHIQRQISIPELVKLLAGTWFTSYERLDDNNIISQF